MGETPLLVPLKEAKGGVAQPMMIWSAAMVILTASWKVNPSLYSGAFRFNVLFLFNEAVRMKDIFPSEMADRETSLKSDVLSEVHIYNTIKKGSGQRWLFGFR